MSKEEKDKIKEYQRKRYQQLSFILASVRISKKTLKFNNVRVNNKEFHKSKQPIDLDLVTVDQIDWSDKFRDSGKSFRYFIGYKEDEIVKTLCNFLLQMSGYIKYFKNGRKNMSFMTKDSNIFDKYSKIWEKLKKS